AARSPEGQVGESIRHECRERLVGTGSDDVDADVVVVGRGEHRGKPPHPIVHTAVKLSELRVEGSIDRLSNELFVPLKLCIARNLLLDGAVPAHSAGAGVLWVCGEVRGDVGVLRPGQPGSLGVVVEVSAYRLILLEHAPY